MTDCEHDNKFKNGQCISCYILFLEGQVAMLRDAVDRWSLHVDTLTARIDFERKSNRENIREMDSEIRQAYRDWREESRWGDERREW